MDLKILLILAVFGVSTFPDCVLGWRFYRNDISSESDIDETSAEDGGSESSPETENLAAEDTPDIGPLDSDEIFSRGLGLGLDDTQEDEREKRDKYDEESDLYLRRDTRQKSCQWLGCQKLPVGKRNCPSGTTLESYKMCDPRGSGNFNMQCCP